MAHPYNYSYRFRVIYYVVERIFRKGHIIAVSLQTPVVDIYQIRSSGVALHIGEDATADLFQLVKRDAKNSVAGTAGWVNLLETFE